MEQNIDNNVIEDKNKKQITTLLVVTIFLFILIVAGVTYSFVANSFTVSNNVYNTLTHCLFAEYGIGNGNNTQDIAGALLPSITASGGLSGRVSMKISNECDLTGTGALKLHIDSTVSQELLQRPQSYCSNRKTGAILSEYTTESACTTGSVLNKWNNYGEPYCENPGTLQRMTAYSDKSSCTANNGVWVNGRSALKYAVYDNAGATGTPLSVGEIYQKDIGQDVIIYSNFTVDSTLRYYYIFIWLDGYLIGDTAQGVNFSGQISASVYQQGSTIEPARETLFYENVQYIASTGTQYINTNYYPNQNTEVYADYQFTAITAEQRLFSNDSNSTSNAVSYSFHINGDSTVHFAYAFSNGKGNWVSTGVNANTSRHTLNYNSGGKVVIDAGSTYNAAISGTVSTTSFYPLYLMARNDMGTVSCYARVRIYAFKIFQNGQLVLDLVPIVTADGVAAMYDNVNYQIYTNAGTGTFSYG